MPQLTPMLRQYLGIKGEYPDAVLFFRMGDFYEMFFDDASTASKILGITLTTRGTYNGEKVPMCGVPHHASKSYISKLVEGGWKVAICEQTESPQPGKGIVDREVVRIVTPGSIVDQRSVDDKSNLFTAAIVSGDERYGLAHVDLTTGEFRVTEVESWNVLLDEVSRIDPVELLLLENDHLPRKNEVSHYRLEILGKNSFIPQRAEKILKEQLGVISLVGFGCREMPDGIIAAGALVHYLHDTQKGSPPHIKEIVSYNLGDFMFLDEATGTHLELLRTMRRQSLKGSLAHILDGTVTSMGSRLLKKWITYPLINLDKMRDRLGAIAYFKDDPMLREKLRDELKEIYDLKRLNGRIALRRANARDLLALMSSIRRLPYIKDALS
ncbi:MAG: DNA mismatch repair protein MutS, partial [Desulfobacterales bacterium]|nr:DNA mismatch repair protein MutS [Desulfobacterales bacterium]